MDRKREGARDGGRTGCGNGGHMVRERGGGRERESEAGCSVIRGRERRPWVKVWQW